jgi:DUF971 family protein
LRPKSIAASKSKALLIIDWIDGHHSEYALVGLRIACPCVECRGGHAMMSEAGSPAMMEGEPASEAAGELEGLERVGNYGLKLAWKDGHGYGIYTWKYLRQLCPCGEHAQE